MAALGGIANTVTDTVSASMKSFTDFLQNGAAKLADASGVVGDFVHPSALVFLYVILFVHFVAFTLENNKNLEDKWPAFAQSMHELRVLIQSVVLGSGVGTGTLSQNGLVFWGSFAIAATVSSSTSSVSEDVAYAMYVTLFYALVWIINQVCMAMLLRKDSTIGTADGSISFATRDPLLSLGKGKPFYIIVSWLQSVTALVLLNSLRGVTYGYGVGKVVGVLVGNPTAF